MMRSLFWPCLSVLALLVIVFAISVTSFSWLSADRGLWFRLTSWRVSIWHATMQSEDRGRGPLHLAPVGFNWSIPTTMPNWSIEHFNDTAIVPDGRSNSTMTVPGNAGALPTVSAHVVNLRRVEFPLLYPLVAWLGISLLPIRAWNIHRRRVKRGWCLKCGYDLTGIAADKPCPECGTLRVPVPAR